MMILKTLWTPLNNLLTKIQTFCNNWEFYNGVFYICGRDIIAATIGFLTAIVICLTVGGVYGNIQDS